MPQIQARRKTHNIYIHSIDQPVVTAAKPAQPYLGKSQTIRRRVRGGRVLYQHATFTAAAAAPDTKPRIVVLDTTPQRRRLAVHNQYQHPPFLQTERPPRPLLQSAPRRGRPGRVLYWRATFTAAAVVDAIPRVFTQRAQKPRRTFRTILSKVAPQAVAAPPPDRRPPVFMQLAPRPRRTPGSVTQTNAGLQPLGVGWRKPFIQTARSARRRARIIIGRVIPFVAPSGGATPPITCSTTATLASGRTRTTGMEATTVTASTATTTIDEMPSLTLADGASSRTDADCG